MPAKRTRIHAETSVGYRFRWRLLALLALAPSAAVGGTPDLADVSIEQLLNLNVSSASRFTQKLSEAPSAVSVVTAADIKVFGWRTLADILRSMRGLHLSNDRNYSYLGARGFLRSGDYNARFLLMVDGARINDAVYDQGSIGLEFAVDVDLIERVEFVPGPGSSIYGANAFFGVINVMTKRGRDINGAQVSIVATSAEGAATRASYGWRGNDGSEWLLSASGFSSRGRDVYFAEFDTPENNHGIARDLDYERGQSVFFRAALGQLQFAANRVQRTKGVPTASYSQTFNHPDSATLDQQSMIDLQYRTTFPRATELTTRLNWVSTGYEGIYSYPKESLIDGSQARRVSGEFKVVSEGFPGHKLVAGMELQRDYQRHQYSYFVPSVEAIKMIILPPGALEETSSAFFDSRTNQRTGIYVQDEITVRPDFLLNAGLRYDRSSTMEGLFNPRLAAIYKWGRRSTVKLLYGTAFRAPNAYELYYMVPGAGGQKVNPGLLSERIRSRELVLEHYFSTDARLTASAFRNSVSDLITLVTDPADDLLVFQNLNRASASGLELEFEKAWEGGAKMRAAVSRQRTVDSLTRRVLENAPQSLVKLNLSRPFLGGAVHSGFEAQYVGRRMTLQGAVDGYWLVNANFLSRHIARGLEASLGIYNVLNHRYADPASAEHTQNAIVQDGRHVRIKLDYRF